jgi:mannitol-1-/sugar-/sorbitol-6-phosphatase
LGHSGPGYSPWMDIDRVRAVLLDMDGTLVDSDASVERAWIAWSHRYEIDPDDAIAIAHGNPADSTVRALRPDLDEAGVAEAAAFQLAMQYDDLVDVVPTTGAYRLIETLGRHGLVWAVVTSADRRLAAVRLGAVGISVPVLVTVEDVERGKPDPEGYLLAARMLGVAAASCLVVEDTETGLEAARSAGAMTGAVKGLDADLRLDDLGQLAELIDTHPHRTT